MVAVRHHSQEGITDEWVVDAFWDAHTPTPVCSMPALVDTRNRLPGIAHWAVQK